MRRGAAALGMAVLAAMAGAVAGLGEEFHAVSFQSNGDLIQGWYWLRDPGLQHRAWWTFEGLPAGTDLVLEITCLATSRVNGPRGVSAQFRLGYGFPGAGMMGGVFVIQEVTLPNVSPPDDPGGYSCRGTVVIPSETPGLAVGKLTVFVERISSSGPHIAFNKDSMVIRTPELPITGGGTPGCTEVGGAQRLRTAEAAGFSSAGALIQGYYWCRQQGHYLEWRFEPLGSTGSIREAAVNLSLLVTNTINGGSGYSIRVIAQILTPEGTSVHSDFVDIRNPFLPVFPGDTGGIGYAAYGALSLPMEIMQQYQLFTRGFRLGIAWPGMRSDYHFAGNKGSAFLAWIEGQ